jgi:catechol 2,3-dioxygenase-like lactoylglutathione lyase family enzyme
MIIGAHVLLYSADAAADRAFLRDTFGFRAVDAGDGWLILALPPAELAVHPDDRPTVPEGDDHGLLGGALYLMCDDVAAEAAALAARGVRCAPVREAGWGRFTTVRLPSGGAVGLYQPAHPTPLAG